MSNLGYDAVVIDEPISPSVAELTGRPHLLSTSGPATPVKTSRANTGTPTVDAQLEVLLSGGASEVIVQGYGASLPTISQAIALLPAGPGSVLAPEAVTSSDLIALASIYGQNKVGLLNGPSGASVAALQTLAAAVIAGADARNCGLWADWVTYSKVAGTVTAPATLGVAAAIARNDANTRNTGLAAAGEQGVLSGAQSIVGGLKSRADRETLKDAQVNTVNIIGSEIRNYTFRTLADLTKLPHWWPLSGARVVMDVRARFAALAESTHAGQIDGKGLLLGKIATLRRGELKDLHDLNALFGETAAEAFSVSTSAAINPPSELALGKTRALTRIKVSTHVEYHLDQIVNRPITATV